MTSWFTTFGYPRTAAPRLLCIHGAGSFASEFQSWPDALGDVADVVAVELPGRAVRMREPCLTTMANIVTALSAELEPWLTEPFALYGHCFGALVTFELAHSLLRDFQVEPMHLFVSGQPAPALFEPYVAADSSDEQIFGYIRSLGGAPEAVLASKAFMRSYLPGMRADLAIWAGYRPQRTAEPLHCPITAYIGAEDGWTSTEQAKGWETETTGPFALTVFPGGHLYMRTALPMLAADLAARLRSSNEV
jgi:medium-chain acyl-[acyl-carrier-protein] hydrolase